MKMLELNIKAQFPCMTLEKHLLKHGLYKMMPPELLHTPGSGLIMNMFESPRDQMKGGKDRELIDK
jgi:hypothetical protein